MPILDVGDHGLEVVERHVAVDADPVQGGIAAGPKAGEGVNKESRCPVCGMFVAKYPQWLAQINMSDGYAEFFDGVKDMLAYSKQERRIPVIVDRGQVTIGFDGGS